MIEEIHAVNRELIAAGVRKFACGISPAANAKTLRKQPGGKVLVTDGPDPETKEHMGGFWIQDAQTGKRRWHGRARARSPRYGGRGARASFLPGPGARIWRTRVNYLVLTIG